MKNKKILILSPLPPPYYGSAMSSEMCLEILRKSKNFEVRNIKLNYSKDTSDIGINKSKIKGFFEVKNRIKKEVQEFAPDLVYFMPATADLGGIRDYLFFKQIRKHTNAKIVFHIRTRIPKNNRKNPIFKRFYKEMFSDKNSYAIILGKELIPDLKGLISSERIFILPNAIKNEISDKELNKAIRQRGRIRSTNILFLSNMDKTKGWPKLLQACKILNERGINFKCYFAGEWTKKADKKSFINFKRKNNLNGKAFYAGKVDKDKKLSILKKSHILVFPTEYRLETFGIVIIEAMMFSMPVIANSIATIPSIIQDKKTGFLLKENTPEEIADKIEILLKNKKLREKMGKEGRKRFLEKFELKNYGKKFVQIFLDKN
jgi:glycosyltransferase involved in cell wall biosynthesis